jgi:hypothetical protein
MNSDSTGAFWADTLLHLVSGPLRCFWSPFVGDLVCCSRIVKSGEIPDYMGQRLAKSLEGLPGGLSDTVLFSAVHI